MKNLSLVLIALFAASTLRAQKLDLTKLSEFSVETNDKVSITVGKSKPETTDETYTFQFKNLGTVADGYQLSCKMVRANIRHNYSSLFAFNSDSMRQTLTDGSGVIKPLMFLEKPFIITLATNGKLLKIEGIDDLVKQATDKWHLREDIVERQGPEVKQEMTAAIKKIFMELPGQKIAYQSTWENKVTGVNYKVTAIAGSLLTITGAAGDTVSSKHILNDVNGLIEEATTSFKRIIPDRNWYETQEYRHKLIYNKHLTASADTTWANMAVMLSFWNKSLRPGIDGKVDTTTAFAYFKKYDPIYKDDPYYIRQKVNLVNQMPNFGNGLYKQLVLQAPHKYLSETELVNKMGYIMETDIDQIYDFVKFRAKSEALYAHIQGSLAHDFLSDNNTGTQEQQIEFYKSQGLTEAKARQLYMDRERIKANKLMLLERLYNDKDAALRQKIVPVYYMRTAYQNKQNTAVLTKTAAQFKKLSKADLIAGNGGRYTLLMYKVLMDAGLTDEAESILDKTIADYEDLLANDTTYNNGSARAVYYSDGVHSILTAANYLKYKAVAKTDSAKALPYLAKAAKYSPLEIAGYGSEGYTNRSLFGMLLGTKDTYRKAYIERLFEMGNAAQAMALFATQISADMGSLDEMEKMYQKRFPDKKFSDFVKNDIIATWQMAPDWSAKDVDGKPYKLADYKGKWLVLDYWATWCPPCRDEMPKVDAFNKELVAGKHAGINLLLVSNGDKEKDIRRYFDVTKFSITNILQDNGLYKYGITAIPTKCLVAPNGKFIKLNHREDWRKVVVKLNQLYAATN